MCRAVDAWASWVPPAASARLALDGQEVKCDALLALSFGHRGTKHTLPTRPLCANAGEKGASEVSPPRTRGGGEEDDVPSSRETFLLSLSSLT